MWDALRAHPFFAGGLVSEEKCWEEWAKAPSDFSYPRRGHSLGKYRTRSRPPYAARRLRAADRRSIDRLKRKPEPHHPDQLFLF